MLVTIGKGINASILQYRRHNRHRLRRLALDNGSDSNLGRRMERQDILRTLSFGTGLQSRPSILIEPGPRLRRPLATIQTQA
jgi:hypothetical protein